MMKPILLVSAFALAAPALAQTTNTGTSGQAGASQGTTAQGASNQADPAQGDTGRQTTATTGAPSQSAIPDASGEGITGSATTVVTTEMDPETEDAAAAAVEQTSDAAGSQGTGSASAATTGQADAHAGHGTAAQADAHAGHGTAGTAANGQSGAGVTGSAGVTGTVGATGTTTTGAATSGAWASGTGGSSGASAGFTGMGGPSGNLLDVAQEMIGDTNRVQQVMRGSDGGMKASDLLNQAMLTLIQSQANTRR